MLMDIAVMIFAFGVAFAVYVFARQDGRPIEPWVKGIMLIGLAISCLAFGDCVKNANDAQKNLAEAQKAFGGTP